MGERIRKVESKAAVFNKGDQFRDPYNPDSVWKVLKQPEDEETQILLGDPAYSKDIEAMKIHRDKLATWERIVIEMPEEEDEIADLPDVITDLEKFTDIQQSTEDGSSSVEISEEDMLKIISMAILAKRLEQRRRINELTASYYGYDNIKDEFAAHPYPRPGWRDAITYKLDVPERRIQKPLGLSDYWKTGSRATQNGTLDEG